jgi:hypothetical protein
MGKEDTVLFHICAIYAQQHQSAVRTSLTTCYIYPLLQQQHPTLIVMGDWNYHHYGGSPSAPANWRQYIRRQLKDCINTETALILITSCQTPPIKTALFSPRYYIFAHQQIAQSARNPQVHPVNIPTIGLSQPICFSKPAHAMALAAWRQSAFRASWSRSDQDG